MTLSFWQQQAREPERSYDVAVVGAGLIGTATAYALAQQRPDLRLALVEAGALAQGASGRNAGFLLQGLAADYHACVETYGAERTRRLWAFTRENRELIETDLPASAIGLERSGSLTVAGTPAEEERLQASVSQLRADGTPAAFIPAAETNRRLVSQGFHGSLYVPSGGTVDPVRLVRYLAETSGAALHTHHPVVALTADDHGLILETTRRRIRAVQVILALNAYLPRLVPALSRYVRPVRAQMLATVPQTPRWLALPIYSHEGYFYVRQHADGALLVGGARHLHEADEVGYADTPTTPVQRDLERYLHRYFPQTATLPVRQRWSGTMGFSPDHLPVVGTVDGLDSVLWAAGFTGHGLGFGVRFGRLLADWLLGRARPDEQQLFAAARFDRAQPARRTSSAA